MRQLVDNAKIIAQIATKIVKIIKCYDVYCHTSYPCPICSTFKSKQNMTPSKNMKKMLTDKLVILSSKQTHLQN